jgi:hypothetical protein
VGALRDEVVSVKSAVGGREGGFHFSAFDIFLLLTLFSFVQLREVCLLLSPKDPAGVITQVIWRLRASDSEGNHPYLEGLTIVSR